MHTHKLNWKVLQAMSGQVQFKYRSLNINYIDINKIELDNS